MKKIQISLIILSTSLFFTACKDNVKVEPVEPVQVDTVKTEVIDTAAVKKQIAAEKETLVKPYNDTEDAQAKLNVLVAQANKEGKNVFVQAGGNWCIWCLRFNDFVQKNQEIKAVVDANYIYYHLNYSKENKNEAVFAKYVPNSKGLGYPFFFILNSKGEVSNTISSADLEANKSYDQAKVKQMFLDNAPKK